MAVVAEFTTYRDTIRDDFNSYVTLYIQSKIGTQTHEAERKLAELCLLESYLLVMEDFDPTETIHMFTAAEMEEFMTQINQILKTTTNVEFTQYYS